MGIILQHEELSSLAIKAFFNVYNELGYGYLEKVYQNAMLIELEELGVHAKANSQIKVYYKERLVGKYYADIIINDLIILELKTATKIQFAHESQVMNYLKGTEIEVGMLFNFGLKPTFKRLIFSEFYFPKT